MIRCGIASRSFPFILPLLLLLLPIKAWLNRDSMPISSGATGSRRLYLPGAANKTNLRRTGSGDQSSISRSRQSSTSSSSNNNNTRKFSAKQTRNNSRFDQSRSSRVLSASSNLLSSAAVADFSLDPKSTSVISSIDLRTRQQSSGNVDAPYRNIGKQVHATTMAQKVSCSAARGPLDKSGAKIGGQMVLIGSGIGKPQSSSTSALTAMNSMDDISTEPNQRAVDVGHEHACYGGVNSATSNNSNFFVASNQNFRQFASSSTTLQQSNGMASNSSSTGRLHSFSNLLGSTSSNHIDKSGTTTAPLNIRRNVNLKYVKTLLILLMAIDLLVTIFVHHFSSHDEFTIWFTSYKLRYSLVNLILSSIWFIVLIGAIMFDIYFILIIGCLVDVVSFVVLLVFTILHFSRRIDYNTVNLTSFLVLLFSLIILHVYLVVMATLTIYLAMAVKQRHRSRRT